MGMDNGYECSMQKGFHRWDCEKGQCYLCLFQSRTDHCVAAGGQQERPSFKGQKLLRTSAPYGSGLSWGRLFPTYLLQPAANVTANVCLDCPLTFMDQMMLSETLHEPGAHEPGIPPPPPASMAGTLRLLPQRPMKGHATFTESGKFHVWDSTFPLPGTSPCCCELKLCSLSAAARHKKKIVSHKLLLKCTLHVNCKINSLNSFHWAQHQKENEPTAVDYFCWIGFNHLYWCPSFFSWLPSLKTPIANFI